MGTVMCECFKNWCEGALIPRRVTSEKRIDQISIWCCQTLLVKLHGFWVHSTCAGWSFQASWRTCFSSSVDLVRVSSGSSCNPRLSPSVQIRALCGPDQTRTLYFLLLDSSCDTGDSLNMLQNKSGADQMPPWCYWVMSKNIEFLKPLHSTEHHRS